MRLSELKPARGATKRRKRRGCGPGSGHGKTSTRGTKGEKSRSGHRVKRGYEGGQMPLIRRIPKRGFTNIFSEKFDIINVQQLSTLPPNTEVTPAFLKERGFIKGDHKVKILGQGELSVSLSVKAHRFSKSAQEKIVGAKGTIEVIK